MNPKSTQITQRSNVYGEYTDTTKAQRHYNMVKKHLANKLQKGEKLRVAFYVLFDSIFPGKPLYNLMLKDDMFEPFIVVIPEINKDVNYIFEKMQKNHLSLSREFEHVYNSYTEKTGFIDFSDKADLICFSNVYDALTHEFYTMEHVIKKPVLPFALSYGFHISNFTRDNVINLAFFNSIWKNFTDTTINLLEFIKYTVAQGKNTVLTGYGKMDALAHFTPKPRTRKKIIIAPHHTVNFAYLQLSNFLEYSRFFLDLPKRYPDIDFVFRPHPLLVNSLLTTASWTQEKIDQYLTELSSLPNMEYQNGGDYLETFANSDALIHDCGSFMAEYLFTGKPACLMVNNLETLPKTYAQLGLNCTNHHELAQNSNDIIKFIDEVVINGIDTKKEERIEFANRHLKVNYPHASNKILEHIKEELRQNKCENDKK